MTGGPGPGDWVADDTASREETLARFAALRPEPTRGPARQLRWWRPGGFRWPWLSRRTNGRWGLGRWTRAEVDQIKADAARRHAQLFPPDTTDGTG